MQTLKKLPKTRPNNPAISAAIAVSFTEHHPVCSERSL